MLENMTQTLEREHYIVETASDYKSALHKYESTITIASHWTLHCLMVMDWNFYKH